MGVNHLFSVILFGCYQYFTIMATTQDKRSTITHAPGDPCSSGHQSLLDCKFETGGQNKQVALQNTISSCAIAAVPSFACMLSSRIARVLLAWIHSKGFKLDIGILSIC